MVILTRFSATYKPRISTLNMTDFANYIIDEAAYWLMRDCKEHSSTPNQSVCVNEIKGGVTNEDWCALFVYRCVSDAAAKSGARNPLKRTPSTRSMLQDAQQKGVRINRTPTLGSVFFRERGAGKGHMGIVTGLSATQMFCIEGNTSNRVGMRNYILQDVAKSPLNYQFMHVHDAPVQVPWRKTPYNLRPGNAEDEAYNVAQQKARAAFITTGLVVGGIGVLGYIIYNQLEEYYGNQKSSENTQS